MWHRAGSARVWFWLWIGGGLPLLWYVHTLLLLFLNTIFQTFKTSWFMQNQDFRFPCRELIWMQNLDKQLPYDCTIPILLIRKARKWPLLIKAPILWTEFPLLYALFFQALSALLALHMQQWTKLAMSNLKCHFSLSSLFQFCWEHVWLNDIWLWNFSLVINLWPLHRWNG